MLRICHIYLNKKSWPGIFIVVWYCIILILSLGKLCKTKGSILLFFLFCLWILDSFKAVSSLLLLSITSFPLHSPTSDFYLLLTCIAILNHGSSRVRCRLRLPPRCHHGVSPEFRCECLKTVSDGWSERHSPKAPYDLGCGGSGGGAKRPYHKWSKRNPKTGGSQYASQMRY